VTEFPQAFDQMASASSSSAIRLSMVFLSLDLGEGQGVVSVVVPVVTRPGVEPFEVLGCCGHGFEEGFVIPPLGVILDID